MPRSACRASALASIAVVAGMLLPTSASAQRCLGTAPLRESTGRIGVVAAHNERARSLGGSVTAGITRQLFASASLSRLWIDVADKPSPAFVAMGGFAIDVNWPRDILAFQLCPFATFEAVQGPEINFGPGIPRLYVHSNAYRGGLAVGGAVLERAWFSVVPTGSLSWVREVAHMKQSRVNSEDSETYRLLDYGLGVVFKGVFTVQGMVSVPLANRAPGMDKLKPTYGLMLGLNVGGSSY